VEIIPVEADYFGLKHLIFIKKNKKSLGEKLRACLFSRSHPKSSKLVMSNVSSPLTPEGGKSPLTP
jgi:hypothetical protein